MARTITIVCDICQAEDVTTIVQAETPPVAIGNQKPRVIALCTEHEQPFKTFETMLTEYGQVVDGSSPARSVAPLVADESGRMPCPICGKSAKNRASLGSHLRHNHDITLTEWTKQQERAAGSADQPLDLVDALVDAGKAHKENRRPPITRTECEICHVVYEWPKNGRPAQALGLHKRRVHEIRGPHSKPATQTA